MHIENREARNRIYGKQQTTKNTFAAVLSHFYKYTEHNHLKLLCYLPFAIRVEDLRMTFTANSK